MNRRVTLPYRDTVALLKSVGFDEVTIGVQVGYRNYVSRY